MGWVRLVRLGQLVQASQVILVRLARSVTLPVAPCRPHCFYCSISKIDPKNVYLATSVLNFGCSIIFFWASESLISNLKSIKRAPLVAPCRPQPKTQPKIHKAGGRPLSPPDAPNLKCPVWSPMIPYGLVWSLMVIVQRVLRRGSHLGSQYYTSLLLAIYMVTFRQAAVQPKLKFSVAQAF